MDFMLVSVSTSPTLYSLIQLAMENFSGPAYRTGFPTAETKEFRGDRDALPSGTKAQDVNIRGEQSFF